MFADIAPDFYDLEIASEMFCVEMLDSKLVELPVSSQLRPFRPEHRPRVEQSF